MRTKYHSKQMKYRNKKVPSPVHSFDHQNIVVKPQSPYHFSLNSSLARQEESSTSKN